MMKLYKDTGTNPLASCLPIILQAPIFFALFRVLNGAGQAPPQGRRLPDQARWPISLRPMPQIFGADLSATFIGAHERARRKIVTAVLILLMSATTFITQRQLMSKNMPADAMNNPFAQQQKILLYVFPLVFAVFGMNFPVGVLIYWLTTNLWSMGQQFYVIRRNPAPGSPACRSARAAQGRPRGPAPPRRRRARPGRSGRRGGRPARRRQRAEQVRAPDPRRPAATARGRPGARPVRPDPASASSRSGPRRRMTSIHWAPPATAATDLSSSLTRTCDRRTR